MPKDEEAPRQTDDGEQIPAADTSDGFWATIKKQTSPGLVASLLGAFCFAVMALLVKKTSPADPPMLGNPDSVEVPQDYPGLSSATPGPFQIVFWRSLFMLVLTFGILLARKVDPFGEPSQRPLLILRGALGFLFMACYFYAIQTLPLSNAVVLCYTSPVLTAAIAALFLGERWHSVDALGSAVCLVGVGCVCQPFGYKTHTGDPLGSAAALAAAVLSSGVNLLVHMLKETDPTVFVHYFALVSLTLSLPMALIFREEFHWPEGYEWLLMILLALFSVTGQVFTNIGLQLETAAKATAMSYTQVAWAYLFQVVLLHEETHTIKIVGAALITIWGLIALLKEHGWHAQDGAPSYGAVDEAEGSKSSTMHTQA